MSSAAVVLSLCLAGRVVHALRITEGPQEESIMAPQGEKFDASDQRNSMLTIEKFDASDRSVVSGAGGGVEDASRLPLAEVWRKKAGAGAGALDADGSWLEMEQLPIGEEQVGAVADRGRTSRGSWRPGKNK